MFKKFGKVTSLGLVNVGADGRTLTRVASSNGAANSLNDGSEALAQSVYIDGTRKIDVKAAVAEAAQKYALSTDPEDYFFEVIAAVTASVPNENNDCFTKEELLRFDTRLATVVYKTFVGCPHHLNHKTDDPKEARGFILDAHYNDKSEPLEFCPRCNTRTAEVENRDAAGIHCRCGQIVKREFVELLLAIDNTKDKAFAEHVKTGALNATSMGCNCESTTCNVCGNVARSVRQFCAHIRGAAKGGYYKREGTAWRRVDKNDVHMALKTAGWKMADNFTSVSLSGFEVRKAFERCYGTQFEEQSRVDRPADPTALQIEIVKPADVSKAASAVEPATARRSREIESDLLAVTARLNRLENSMTDKFFVVRVNDNPMDTHAGVSLQAAVAQAMPDKDSKLDYCVVTAADAHTARLQFSAQAMKPVVDMHGDRGGAVTMEVPDDVKVEIQDPNNPEADMEGMGMDPSAPGGAQPGQPLQPGQPPMAPQVPNNAPGGPAGPASPEDFGVLPVPQAGKMASKAPAPKARPWDNAISDAFGIELHAHGADVVHTGSDGEERVFFSVKASKELKTSKDLLAFGTRVQAAIGEHGLLGAYRALQASLGSKVASLVDDAIMDFEGGVEHVESLADGGDEDIAGSDRKKIKTLEPKKLGPSDIQDSEKGSLISDILGGAEQDDIDGASPPEVKTMAGGGDNDIQGEQPKPKKNESISDGAMRDFKAAVETAARKQAMVVEDRLRRAFQAQLAQEKRAMQEKIASDSATRDQASLARVVRVMRLAAQRMALDLEESPLKTAMVNTLTEERVVGVDTRTKRELVSVPLTAELASDHVHTAWARAHSAEIERLATRTAEMLSMSDEYLVDAERDLSKISAAAPRITSIEEVEPAVSQTARTVRAALEEGNIYVTPSEVTETAPTDGDLGGVIRHALSGTRVGLMARRLAG